jgi:predicted ATPase
VALQLIELDPLQEAVHWTIMRLYARQGRRAAALNHYQGLVELLRREMGAEPETESRPTYQALLRQAPGPLPDRQIGAPRQGDSDGGHGMEPPLLGRDGELLRLAALAGSVRAGHGRTVVLIAEAGGGKTRKLAELASSWLATRRAPPARGGRAI